jgi:hypothetical protein
MSRRVVWLCAAALAVDDQHVYWVGAGETSPIVLRAALDGSGSAPFAQFDSPDTVWLRGITIHGDSLYVAGGCKGHVYRAPLDGSAPSTLAMLAACVHDVAVSDDSIYFTASGDVRATLWQVPLAGGTPTPVAGAQPSTTGCGETVAVSATDLYWTDNCAGTISKMPLAGGTATVIDRGADGGEAIALDDTDVYWSLGGEIRHEPLAGGTPTAIAKTSRSPDPNVSLRVYGLAVAKPDVYWSQAETDGSGTLRHATLPGDGSSTVIANLQFPETVALAPSIVFHSAGSNCIGVTSR